MEKQPTGPRMNWVHTETKDERIPALGVNGPVPILGPLSSHSTSGMADGGPLQLSQTRQTNQRM